jgi:hypothetical protein
LPVEISKGELKNYLNTFLKSYRAKIKKEYPAYFNEFPFYSALKAIGAITPNKVYIFFTKDGNPKRTTIEVFDENDIPELMKVKDAYNRKSQDVYALLGIETFIPDLVYGDLWQGRLRGKQPYFNERNTILAVDLSIGEHYKASVETGNDLTRVLKPTSLIDVYKPSLIPKYSFVYNTIDETFLREKVKEIVDKAEKGEEILITGWIGSFGVRLLNSMMKRNVKFRIITHKPTPPEKGKSPSDQYEVFTKVLSKKYPENVRILAKLHARLLISDKEALVSTADLTKDSHEGKYEAGISTTDGLAIMKLKEFFKKCEVSTKLRISK